MKSERRYQDLIDEAFLGTISPRAWESLREHMAACTACQERYNRTVRAERRLAGAAVSPGELDRVEAAIFSRLAPARPSLSERVRAWRPVLVGLAAAAAVLLFVIIPFREEDELRPRGLNTSTRPAAIRVFCLSEDGAAPLGAGSRCGLSAQLKLSLENRGGYRYAFLVGVQEDRSPRWYEPRPPQTESVKAPEAGAGEVPFGGAVRLEVNHQKGPLRIFGLFSDEPITSAAVEGAIRSQAKSGVSISDAELLPLEAKDVAQRSVLVEVAP